MKQILILVKTVFVELIYLSSDLKTTNGHITLLDYYLRERSVPPVSAILYRPDFPCFSTLPDLRTFIVLHGYLSLSVRPVDQQQRQLTVRFYPRCYYVRSGVVVSALGKSGRPWTDSYTKQTKKLSHLICFSSEDKFREHFNLRRKIQHAPKCIIMLMDIKLKHEEQSIKKLAITFKFHLFMLSSNDWMVQLIAIEVIELRISYNCLTVKSFGNFVSEVPFPAFLESKKIRNFSKTHTAVIAGNDPFW